MKMVMEETVSRGIVESYFEKLQANLSVDAAIVGGGPSGLVAAYYLAKAGRKVTVFERKLATGDVMGEMSMSAEEGETTTVQNTKEIYPGLFVSGMASNGVSGSFRMGPIFGGMLLSGKKVAELMLESIAKF